MASPTPIRSQPEAIFLQSKTAHTGNIRSQAAKRTVEKVIERHAPIFSLPVPEGETMFPDEDDGGSAPRAVGKICIIGAGVAGLYTAMILDSLGIDYDILEANPDRIGGRLFTHRFNGEAGRNAPINDPARYDYIDIGAMRYPRIDFMKRVFDLFQRLDMIKDNLLIEYKYSAANTVELYNDVRYNTADPAVTDVFNVSKTKGGAVPDDWVAKGVDQVAKDIYQKYNDAFQLPGNFQNAWKLLTEQDPYSTRGYLLSHGYPEPVVEWLETFQTATGLYNQAFVESVMDAMDFSCAAPAQTAKKTTGELEYDWFCVDGGSDHISNRMAERIRVQPKMGHRVTKIYSKASSTMQVEHKSSAGTVLDTYDQVICTAPLGCISDIEFPNTKDLSYMKRLAIRALNYDTSTKVALRFETRWWEDPAIMGQDRTIKGGISSTDLPIRTCVYPSYGWHANGPLPGVLLASYTWAQDAQRLGGLAQAKGSQAYNDLIDLVLKNLAELHGIQQKQMGPLLDSYVLDWHSDRFARGAFALFGPGQFGHSSEKEDSLFASMKAPGANGRLHIAGEATSVHHAWVLGALNSAWRAVYYALGKFPDAEAKRQALINEWGIPDEEDLNQLQKLAVLARAEVI